MIATLKIIPNHFTILFNQLKEWGLFGMGLGGFGLDNRKTYYTDGNSKFVFLFIWTKKKARYLLLQDRFGKIVFDAYQQLNATVYAQNNKFQ